MTGILAATILASGMESGKNSETKKRRNVRTCMLKRCFSMMYGIRGRKNESAYSKL
jgi:hypothetical protein